jgi:hypothetical protein
MTDGYFAPTVFIEEHGKVTVDVTQTPFFYNDGGTPTYVADLPAGATLLTAAPTDPSVAMGAPHDTSGPIGETGSSYGTETELGFRPEQIRYEPLWATRDTAAAFGITLVSPGEAVMVESPAETLHQIEYEYGVFAGHWSPYQNTGNALLSVVCTDLEHHDFPHVFASTDSQNPLVISVGRYWPAQGRICLADLWVPYGAALYIPPKPDVLGAACIDLHNNRNSARACWGKISQPSIRTHTLLQTSDTFTYWYWNPADTEHSAPLLY